MKKIDKKTTIISLFLISIPLLFSLIYFICNNWLGSNSFFHTNPEELALISHYSFWWFLIRFDIYSYFAYLLPLIITIMSCNRFFSIYHSGYIYNFIHRVRYDKFMKEIFLSSWLKNLILPLLFLLLFIITIAIFPNAKLVNPVKVERLLFPFQSGHEYMLKMNPLLFVALYLIIIFLYGVFITNLGLIVCRYIKKFSLFVIANYIVFMILENIFNFFVAPFVKMITNYDRMMNGFSILNFYYLDGIPSLLWEFTWVIFLIVITSLIVYKIYSNEEEVLMDYE